jgi:hypothetical protein
MKAKSIIAILLITIALPVAAFAGKKKEQPKAPDSGPTLKETSDWLAKTLTAYGGFVNGYVRWEYNNVVLDNDCKFSLILSITEPQDPSYFLTSEMSLPVGAVDRIEELPADSANDRTIMLHTGQLAVVHGLTHSSINPGKDNNDDGNFLSLRIGIKPDIRANETMPLSPEEMVPHIVNALQHAANLCRSVYKPPTQEKQPF